MADGEDFVAQVGDLVHDLLLDKFAPGKNSMDYFLELRGVSNEDRAAVYKVQVRAINEGIEQAKEEIRRRWKNERVAIKQVRGHKNAAAIRASTLEPIWQKFAENFR